MLFHSQIFLLLFLPLALAAFWSPRWGRDGRVAALVVVSAAFYGWWDPRFLPLLAASMAVNWLLGRAIAPGAWRLAWLGIGLNLALLAFYKYAEFFAGEVAASLGAEPPRLSLILPLGISFFTFQQIGWLVDRARGRAAPHRALDYAAWVLFFPHLIAGPIVRHDELIHQFDADPRRPGAAERAGRGVILLVGGLAKKLFLADALAPHVDRVFTTAAGGTSPGAAEAWGAALGYALQLYLDFSAYSEMAMGLALLFGLQLPQNFDAPYRAASPRAFWRRWHISLSRWFRDYVYIPLGGNRLGPWGQAGATLVTMGLCGLWHGAGWAFVVWGLAHGALVAADQAWHRARLPDWPRLPAIAAMALAATLLWVPFRAADLGVAGTVYAGLAGAGGAGAWPPGLTLPLLLGLVVVWALPTLPDLAARPRLPAPRVLAAALGITLAVAVLLVGPGRSRDFLYFQF